MIGRSYLPQGQVEQVDVCTTARSIPSARGPKRGFQGEGPVGVPPPRVGHFSEIHLRVEKKLRHSPVQGREDMSAYLYIVVAFLPESFLQVTGELDCHLRREAIFETCLLVR